MGGPGGGLAEQGLGHTDNPGLLQPRPFHLDVTLVATMDVKDERPGLDFVGMNYYGK